MAFGARALGIKLSGYLTDRVAAYKAQIQALRAEQKNNADSILILSTIVIVFEEFIKAIQYAAID